MEYKHSTFQLGLQARNVIKSEKNHINGSYWLFISKPVKCQQQRENKEETIIDKGIEEKRLENRRVEKRRKGKIREEKRRKEKRMKKKRKK